MCVCFKLQVIRRSRNAKPSTPLIPLTCQVHCEEGPGDILVFLTGAVGRRMGRLWCSEEGFTPLSTPSLLSPAILSNQPPRPPTNQPTQQAKNQLNKLETHPTSQQPTNPSQHVQQVNASTNNAPPTGQEEIDGLERLLMDKAAALPEGAAGRGGGPDELWVLPIYAALPPDQQMKVRARRRRGGCWSCRRVGGVGGERAAVWE